ncbi:MAG TPA: hypothetical protein VMV14_03905 [Acidimicrobiales bacterium]|nr:hypothetical protein [Acidimicrobiales bacterium]
MALLVVVPVVASHGGRAADAATTTTSSTTSTSSTTTTSTPTKPKVIPGYWLVATDGGIFAFGGLPFYGSMGGKRLNKPMVAMAATPDGKGYWTVASDGGIFSFGDAAFHGSMGGTHLNQPVMAMATDPVTGGYWLVASDGGIFSFGAPFYGSMGGTHLNQPVMAMAATPDGKGYWLFASDGGIFSFGDAPFHGSMGGSTLNAPIVGAAAPDIGGYWLVASDGGIFSFGDAQYQGSLGGHDLSRPIATMAAADAGGYWTTDTNGAVTAFGDGGYFGSTPQQLAAPVVGMAEGPGNGDANGNGIYPSGSYGYDVSVFNDNPPQCSMTLPSGHTIGVVQATGLAGSAANPCIVQEAQWAGAGLDLYIFLDYGQSQASEPGCNNDPACNFGYAAALYGFNYANTNGVNPFVTWWLDVEDATDYWSSNVAENAQVVQGAINGLRDKGINNVGVYTSPDTWDIIVGSYQPAVPVWVAWYSGQGGPYNCQNIGSYAAANHDTLPTGPVWLTQYSDNAATQSNGQSVDGDYAC